jgi:hypothetical protein
MLEQFADDAELAFEGVPVGPFRGKPAIAGAYAEQPPDDEIVILRTRESGDDLVVADYAWRADPVARAGSLILRLRDARDRPARRHLRLGVTKFIGGLTPYRRRTTNQPSTLLHRTWVGPSCAYV